MKAVIQRVRYAKVSVGGEVISQIGKGILTLFGVAKDDSDLAHEKLIQKIIDLRIFEDEQGKMNLSLKDIRGEHLIVSQFTLCGDTSKGRRPSFIGAETPERAQKIYLDAIRFSNAQGIKTLGGEFGADMKIELLNDGPVTFILEQ